MEKRKPFLERVVISPAFDVFPLIMFIASYATQDAVDDWAAGIAIVIWLFAIWIRSTKKD